MKISNIQVKKVFKIGGVDKTAWLNVGRMVTFGATEDKPEQTLIELNMFPETKFYVFEQAPKIERKIDPEPQKDINPDDIPF